MTDFRTPTLCILVLVFLVSHVILILVYLVVLVTVLLLLLDTRIRLAQQRAIKEHFEVADQVYTL